MSVSVYFTQAVHVIGFSDLIPATLKTVVFGFIIAVVSSYLANQYDGRHRGRGTHIDTERRQFVNPAHHHQRRAGAAHLLSVSGMTAHTEGGAPVIELRRVTKRFGARMVLDDVSLTVPAARGFCLLGRSGTGKSVTLKHIIGLLAPDSGHVLVEGADVGAMTTRELSKMRLRIGYLFQNAALFDSMTVGENVAFPLRRHTRLSNDAIVQRATELLARVGLERDYDKMPADLSGGMRKRAGLSRAMALDPPILLVDEPSAGLDPVTSAEIDALLLDLKRRAGTTLVVVTHHMASAQGDWRRVRVSRPGEGAGTRVRRGARPLGTRTGPRVPAVNQCRVSEAATGAE